MFAVQRCTVESKAGAQPPIELNSIQPFFDRFSECSQNAPLNTSQPMERLIILNKFDSHHEALLPLGRESNEGV